MEYSERRDKIKRSLWNVFYNFRDIIGTDNSKDTMLIILFLKYISDIWTYYYETDEKKFSNEPTIINDELFNLPKDASFYSLWNYRHEPGNCERIGQALQDIGLANNFSLKDAIEIMYQDISFNSERLDKEKNKNNFLCSLLEAFAKVDFNLRLSYADKLDTIESAHKYITNHFPTDNEQKNRDFYTPTEVSDLIAALLEPKTGDAICDPVCGSGTFLIKCARHIEVNHSSQDCALYGQEIGGANWLLTNINMALHGKDNNTIAWGDTIRKPKLLDIRGELILFDVVVANPPFSLDKWGYEEASEDKFKRFSRGIPPKTRGDYAFLLHMIETLKEKTGRMGVVVPHGVLFRGVSEGDIRKKLIEENLLDAVIGLPEKLFYGTGIPAAIMIFKKQKVDDKVLFIDASCEFKSGKNQNQLTEDNIKKILLTYQNRENIGKYAYLASREALRDNDYNLNIPRYVNTFEEEKIELTTVRAERENLKAELKQLESKVDKYLSELGY